MLLCRLVIISRFKQSLIWSNSNHMTSFVKNLLALILILFISCSDESNEPEKIDISGKYQAEVISLYYDYAPSFTSWETVEETVVDVTIISDSVYHISIVPNMDFTLASKHSDSLVFNGIPGYPFDHSFTFYIKTDSLKGSFGYTGKLSGNTQYLKAVRIMTE